MSTKSFGCIQLTYLINNSKDMQDLSTKQHFVGCDVSKDTLDLALYQPKTDYRKFEHVQISNDTEGFKQLLQWLKARKIKKNEVAIAFEHTGAYSIALAEWLHKKKITFSMLHPLDVKNACSRGRNKTDEVDAKFIADYAYTMREKLAPSGPEPKNIKHLRELRNERDLCVRCRASYLCQIKVQTEAQTIARMHKMADFMTVQIHQIEEEIKKIIAADETIATNYHLLISIPGIGMVNAVNTIVATGNFTRFQTSRQYAKFCSVSPMAVQSGTSVHSGNHVCKKGHNELKATLSEAARSAIIHDPQLRHYYQRKRSQGKSHGCVMNAVKFKLICRMFAVIKRQQPYVNTECYRG